MALLFIEGFEQYTIADEETMGRNSWNSPSGLNNAGIKIQAGTRHTTPAGQELLMDATNVIVARGIGGVPQDFICGFAFQISGSFLNIAIIDFIKGGVVQFSLFVTNVGEIEIRRGSSITLETTSGLGLAVDTWYYAEIECFIDNTTGNYDLHIDGQSVASDTNVDTQQDFSTKFVEGLRLHGNATMDTKYDDIYFLDKVGSDNVDFLGDCRVETVLPDANGNENDFTRVGGGSSNFEAVDDTTVDDDTTYNHSATATERELYGFAALTGDIDTIFGVQASMIVRKEEAGFRAVRVISRNGTTEVESPDKTLGVKYIQKNHVFENNPDGGGDWTETTVNTAQFGLDLQT